MPPVISEARSEFRRTLVVLGVVVMVSSAWLATTLAAPPQPGPLHVSSQPYSRSGLGRQGGPPLGLDFKFQHLSLEEGLSQSVVAAILQDSQGFMWFGTEDGLNRYDGYDFFVYKHDPEDPGTLGGSFVWALHEDSTGALWIGTNGGGLNRYDRETGQFIRYQHDPDDPHSLSSNVVQSLAEDDKGVLWVGTGGGGLDRFDPTTGQFAHYQHDPQDPNSLSHNSVTAIFQDQDGALWVGTQAGGLNQLFLSEGQDSSGGGAHFVRYQNEPGNACSLSHDFVHTVYQDREGLLWVGTNGGLNQLDRASGCFVRYHSDPNDPTSLSNDAVWAIHQDRSGALWVGTFGGGLDRFDPETRGFGHLRSDPDDPYSLNNDQIWSIYEDRVGALWIGTFGGGVNRYDRGQIKFEHYRSDPKDANSLSENVVWAIEEDREGTLWIGTNGGGLNRLERGAGAGTPTLDFFHYLHESGDPGTLSDNVVWSIEEGSDGSLWIGTSQGLDRFELGTGRVVAHYPTVPVFVIEQDAEGLLWFGTWGAGLGRLDPESEQLVFYQHDPDDPDSLGDGGVIAILQDRNGQLWIGTFNGGLNRFDPETEQFIHYNNDLDDPNTLSSNTVLAIHEDRDGILWIATGGGGLNRFDPTSGTFVAYREKDGLPNDTVYGILEDDALAGAGGSNLWLSTNRGLSRFNPQTGEFRNYDVGDGLQSNEFNQNAYLKSRSGEMFFGGINGFNAFYPDQVQDNPNIPPVVLTSLTQGGEEVQLGSTVESARDLTLRWPRNFFEFEFAALNYAQPEENRYAYMLDGFDPGWIETGVRRFGQYTNLPGGTYMLRVRGSNNDGLWNEDGRALKVTVVPPFWQTWWFRGGVALVLLTGIVGGYRLRVRSIEARSRELEALVADRTRELAALNAVADVVSRSLDLTEILDDALEMVLRVTEMEGGGVYLVEDGGGALSLATHRGFDSQLAGEIDGLRIGEGPCGQVVQSSEPLALEDLAGEGCFGGLASGEGGFRSLVSVPLASKGNVLGALFAMTRDHRLFKDEDVELLTSIGQQMGVATENARLYEQARRLAVVEERQRLARDLHDSVTQALYGMTLYSEAAAAQLSRDNLAKVIEYVRLLQDTAYEALAEMRLLIYELRPPVLEEEGLVAALESRLQAVEGRAGLKTTFEVDLVDPLPGDIEAGLYWIAKEALNNTLKHAQARSVAVRLGQKPLEGLVSLQIDDDGVGFEPASVLKSGGLGLPAMHERADALGGKLSMDSHPGEGTRLLVELYYDRSD